MPSSLGRYSRVGSSTKTGRGSREGGGGGGGGSPSDIAVSVTAQQIATSRLLPTATWVNNPNTWRQAGWANALASMQNMLGGQSTHFDPFGNTVMHYDSDALSVSGVPNNLYGETSPGPSTRNPSNPSTNSFMYGLDRMRDVSSTGRLHVKLFSAALWWAKHEVGVSGGNYTYTDLTFADRSNADYGRPKYSNITQWKDAYRIGAKKAMVAPYNVRYFSVWNETKGFWDGLNGRWDMSYNTLPLGYTRFYKEMVDAVVQGATELGIDPLTLRFGGPYAIIRGRGTNTVSLPSNHPYASLLNNQPWGWTEKHGVLALEWFLSEVASRGIRLEYLSMDGADYNKDGTGYPASTDWVNGQRWHNWHVYFRAILGDYGLDSNMDIMWDENYRYPLKLVYPTGTTRDNYGAALMADFYMHCVLDGVAMPMTWGVDDLSFGDGSDLTPILTDAGSASGGIRKPLGNVIERFTTHFAPDRAVFYSSSSDGNSVRTIANNTHCFVLNKTNTTLNVSINGQTPVAVGPYEVPAIAY